MIIIIKKDGTVITDDGNPVDIKALDNAALLLADPKNGDSIVYDASAGCWVAGEGGGSFAPDITNPQDGDTLVYDASEQKWVNGAGGGSGGGMFIVNDVEGTLDKTYAEILAASANNLVALRAEADGMTFIKYLDVIGQQGSAYVVEFFSSLGGDSYETDSEDGYPGLSG